MLTTWFKVCLVALVGLIYVGCAPGNPRHHPKPHPHQHSNNPHHAGHHLNLHGPASHDHQDYNNFPRSNIRPHALFALKYNDTLPSSIISWDTVDEPKRISLLTVAIQHGHDGGWYIPSVHEKHSVGKN
jgi:hypothetical protein